MRSLSWLVIATVALWGCSKGPDRRVGTSEKDEQAGQGPLPEPESLSGEYVGKLTSEESPEDSPLPPSIREVIGDASLTIDASNRTFTLLHKGLELKGTYNVEADQMTWTVETVEGLSEEDLANVDLAANKAAGKEPASQAMLDLFSEILLLDDWRFKVENDGFSQLGEGNSPPRYRFTRKE